MGKKEKSLRIQLVRGLAGKRRDHRETVHALGLRRNRQVVEKIDTPSVRGQIHKVAYLLQVEEIG